MSGPINSDVSWVNIATALCAQREVAHCYVFMLSATIASPLTLSWFSTSNDRKFRSRFSYKMR